MSKTGDSEETVKEVVETVKEMVEAVKGEEENMSMAVVGVLTPPKEGLQYERLRRMTNQKLHMQVMKIKTE